MSLKLDAINSMLMAIPTSPETNLDNPTNLQTSLALTVLEEVKREVLTETEWKVATRYNVILEPDIDGNITVSQNFLAIIPSETDRQNGKNYVARGQTLYDILNDTTIFTSSIRVTVVENLDYTLLTPKLQIYVRSKAKRRFHRDIVNDPQKNQLLMDEEEMAKSVAYREETNLTRSNMFVDNPALRDMVTRRQNIYPRY